ncbi:MAG: hypothetical protein V5A34_05210 [Halapricum sp.]
MATTDSQCAERPEHCQHCERETTHIVSLELVTESDSPDNAEFSREPYRVSKCLVCGEKTADRMNNA